jgi:RNA polymerase sigma factor (sigma-70 family)
MNTHKGGDPLLPQRLGDERFAPLTGEDSARISAALSAAIAAGDVAARRRLRDELIERHLRLVVSIGRGYEHRLEREDIFAIGTAALVEAMERWSPAPGGMSAYQWAKRWITTALNKGTDAARTIRIPEGVAYRAALATKAVKEKQTEIGRRLSEAEILETTGGVLRLEDLPLANVSLNQGVGRYATDEQDNTIEDVIADPAPGAEHAVEREDRFDRVRRSLDSLTEEERFVIQHRFGLEGAEGKTLAELGSILDTSAEVVRRIEASAFAKLTHPANPAGLGEL